MNTETTKDYFRNNNAWKAVAGLQRPISSVVGLESAPGLESDSSPYFGTRDLDSNFAHETKVKAIHELLVSD